MSKVDFMEGKERRCFCGEFFLNVKSYVSSNSRTLILTILLFLSVFYSIKLKSQLDEFTIKRNIEGTYIMQTQDMHNSEYFVFLRGKFYRYKQFEVLDEGTYENIYDSVYILKSDNIDEYIIYSNGKFHFYDRKRNDVLIYSKIDNHALFINVDIKR